jgi:hypothetical protein
MAYRDDVRVRAEATRRTAGEVFTFPDWNGAALVRDGMIGSAACRSPRTRCLGARSAGYADIGRAATTPAREGLRGFRCRWRNVTVRLQRDLGRRAA